MAKRASSLVANLTTPNNDLSAFVITFTLIILIKIKIKSLEFILEYKIKTYFFAMFTKIFK